MTKTDTLIKHAEYGILVAKLRQKRPPQHKRCPVYFAWDEQARCVLRRGHTGKHQAAGKETA